MENETDVIRNQMLETRTALTEKLEALEEKVVSTVQDTTANVAETVQNVTEKVEETVSDVSESVHETVESVKSTLDLTRQTENHPWAMFGGAVAVGYLGGCLLPSLGQAASSATEAASSAQGESMPASSLSGLSTGSSTERLSAMGPSSGAPAEKPASNWFAGVSEHLGPVAKQLESMAVGALTGLVGQMMLRSTPETFRPQLADWIEELTRSLGGTPIQGLKEFVNESSRQHQEQTQQQQPCQQHTTVV